MRGFRASRAAQNFKSAHFGKQTHQGPTRDGHQGATATQPQQEKRPLPDWLKIHKTPPEARIKPAATKTTSTKTNVNLRIVRASGKAVTAKATVVTKAATPTRRRKAA